MTRDYNPNSPIINPKLIKKINEARKNKEDNVFLDFLTELYNAEFIMPVQKNHSQELVGQYLFDVVLLQNTEGMYLPIFTNYFEMRKLENTTKNQPSLVTDFYDTTELTFLLAESGLDGVVIDPFGVNLTLSLDFIEGAEEIMKQQKQSKLIKEMHKDILLEQENM